MRNKIGLTTTVRAAQEIVDAKEDEKELEALPTSNISLRWNRVEEPELIEPLAMVDTEGKVKGTSHNKKKKKKRGTKVPKKRKLLSAGSLAVNKANLCFEYFFFFFFTT